MRSMIRLYENVVCILSSTLFLQSLNVISYFLLHCSVKSLTKYAKRKKEKKKKTRFVIF